MEHYTLPEFVAFWIVWALIGLAAGGALFWWALRTRQFEESRRASLIPLDDVSLEPPRFTREGRTTYYIMLGVAGVGVAAVCVSVLVALRAS